VKGGRLVPLKQYPLGADPTPTVHNLITRIQSVPSDAWEDIVEALTLRFAPPPEVLQQVRQSLEMRHDGAPLAQLFTAAIRSTSLAAFQETLAQA
jgi:hypothetical protein